jgi:hypothetical protein
MYGLLAADEGGLVYFVQQALQEIGYPQFRRPGVQIGEVEAGSADLEDPTTALRYE